MTATATVPQSPLRFAAVNVTGTQQDEFEVDPTLTVRSAVESIQARMGLPDDVSWCLRNDRSSAYLDDARPIGEQIDPGARVTITPKTHLGVGSTPWGVCRPPAAAGAPLTGAGPAHG